ncbi:helix-turn-helix domain-containing protein [Rhizobium terrae]|uniref:helix-turn-helix domain-containing protein n=1 Tax=Rhizobium terrae TaxID=2171756 RepID=UPI000E3BD4A2|nr:helix-turn-helix transcriptional regulator [Rhizobium terrae]
MKSMTARQTRLSASSSAEARGKTTDQMIGQQIRLRRGHLGMTQGALAKRLGISFQQVQKYETGANRINSSMLYEISLILEAPIAFFFGALPGVVGEEGKMGPQWAARLAYVSTVEGQTLVDAFQDLPVPVQASILGMVRTLARVGRLTTDRPPPVKEALG